jgi:hypothetical protein
LGDFAVEHDRACLSHAWTRRRFLKYTTAGVFGIGAPWACRSAAGAPSPTGDDSSVAFVPRNQEYAFDTGALRGTLRSGGNSRGLLPLIECSTGTEIARGAGLFSHYRLLDARARYGTAAWDWASQSRRLADGSVEAIWQADSQHPLDLTAVYRWATSNTLDVTTTVTARETLVRFESFLASYFEGFPKSYVYVKACPQTDGKPGFFEAKPSYGDWQMFPRDDQAIRTIQDGRWTRPPHPVAWWLGPPLAAPLVMRRDPRTGLAGLAMAPRQDCFAVATPYGEEGHRSFYLSLFGCDLTAGQQATARARLIIGRGISDQKALALYESYLSEI